ncbi:hypothetical protein B0H10DRAFT_1954776 [Mycena sp. CBHHK59/15]|nr:hypothetical protein B0H10DRAFT_1954776 [Mycena sp. CBHHK59/15]
MAAKRSSRALQPAMAHQFHPLRTAQGQSVQCAPNQPVIDGFFVVYGGELDKIYLEKFSVVAWQTKARSNAATSTILSSLSCPRITGAPKAQYVVLFMDLMTSATIKRKGSNNFWNIENTVEVTFRKAAQPKTLWDGYAKTEPEGWCINARNILAKTYPCLEGVETAFDLLRKATILEARAQNSRKRRHWRFIHCRTPVTTLRRRRAVKWSLRARRHQRRGEKVEVEHCFVG